MTVHKLDYPAALRVYLIRHLPRREGTGSPFVHVTPRDSEERPCAVGRADHYEIAAFYADCNPEFLGPLEEALRQVPGVYLTTRLRGAASDPAGVVVTNPDWPAALGTARRDRRELHSQVGALMSDAGLHEQILAFEQRARVSVFRRGGTHR